MNILEQLQRTELFRDVPADDLQALSTSLHQKVLSAGEILFQAGDSGDSMYIVQSGDIRIYINDGQGQTLTIRHFTDGDTFGEFALIDDKPRSASAAAAVETRLLALSRDELLAFLQARPQMNLAMMRSLSQRARYTTTYLEEVVRWVKRLAKGEYQSVIEDISRESARDDVTSIQNLLVAFLEMVKNMQQRENELKQEVLRLKVQIDQEDRVQQVEQITKSGFFAHLKEQAQQLRKESGQID